MHVLHCVLCAPYVLQGVAALGLGMGWGVVNLLGGGKRKVTVSSSSSQSSQSSTTGSRASMDNATIDVTPAVSKAEPEIDPDVLEQSK